MTLEQIKQKANAGSRRAQAILGKRYEIGFEVRKSEKQALAWYRKSAEQGFALAQMRLGEIYRQMHLDEKQEDMEEAIHWYRQAANQGIVAAQLELAQALEDDDSQEAAHWYHLAAEAGDAKAQFKLAELYERGNGVPKNDEEAFRWYLSAEKLYIEDDVYFGMMKNVSYEVGKCYARGQGVQKNFDEALRRLLPIADPKLTEDTHWMVNAQIDVAIIFADPEYSRHDLMAAYAWLSLAASYAPSGEDYGIGSHESLSQLRDTFAKRLTPAQLKEAQKHSAKLFVSRNVIDKRLDTR